VRSSSCLQVVGVHVAVAVHVKVVKVNDNVHELTTLVWTCGRT
jgi:hypothetical protein